MPLIPKTMRDGLQQLRDGEPGSRFQDHYKKRQEERRSPLRRWLFLGGGTMIILAGIFFLPAPGPGFLIIFLGGGLVAQESLIAARALDWTEVRLRAVADWALRIWHRSSTLVRTLIVIVALAVAGAAAYGAYLIMFAK